MKKQSSSKVIFLYYLAIAVTFAFFLFLQFFQLTAVGLEYDELLNINAALGCPSDHIFLEFSKQIGSICVPIMLSTYIGAIHSWVYSGLLYFLPHTAFSIRFIHVVFVLLGTAFLYVTLQKHFSKQLALFWLFLMTFNIQVVFTHRFERPTVIQYFLLSVWFYLQYSSSIKKYWKFFFQGLLVGLMIFAKQDAVFLVAAMYGGIGLQWIRVKHSFKNNTTLLDVKRNWKEYGIWFLGVLLGILPLLYYLRYYWSRFLFITRAVNESISLQYLLSKVERWVYQWTSNDWYWYVFRQDMNIPSIVNVLSIFLSLLVILAAVVMIVRNKNHQWISYAYLLFLLFFFMYGGLISSHHRLLILPFGLLLLALLIEQLPRYLQIISLSIVFVVFGSAWINWYQIQQKSCGKLSFSCASENLVRELKNRNIKSLYAADWGIATQLLYYGHNQFHTDEVAFRWNAQEFDQQELKHLASACSTFVIFTPENDIFSYTPKLTRKYLSKQENYEYSVILDKFGNPTYQLWSCNE